MSLSCCVLRTAMLLADQSSMAVEPAFVPPVKASAPPTSPSEPSAVRPATTQAAEFTELVDLHRQPELIPTATGTGVAALPVEGQIVPANHPYGIGVAFNQAKSIPWRFGGAAAAITVTGIANWNWGSSPFRVHDEGWFGRDTANLGIDKLGHAWSSYVLTEFFTDGIDKQPGQGRTGAYTAALMAMGLMTYIELFDGFSKDHGFSNQDLIVDAAGALFSVARRTVPSLREKVDFRLLYMPSENTIRAFGCLPAPHCDRDGATFRSPITDYSSQRYILALKLSGFAKLRDTPLRLVELHGGYYARGFTREDELVGKELRRVPFWGVGLNVSQLLFPGRPRGGVGRAAKSVFEYIQLPYTAVHSE